MDNYKQVLDLTYAIDTQRKIYESNLEKNFKSYKGARYYTYVLQLKHGKIYVGSTDNIYRRLHDHWTQSPSSAVWVKDFGPPIRIMEIIVDSAPDEEHYKFTQYASRFGFDNVRGAAYCMVSLREPACVKEFVPRLEDPQKSLSRIQIDEVMDKLMHLKNRVGCCSSSPIPLIETSEDISDKELENNKPTSLKKTHTVSLVP